MFACDQKTLSNGISSRPELPQQYDIIICLGSCIAHLLTDEDLTTTLKGFHSLLRPGGAVIMDHRNYLPAIETGVFNDHGLSHLNRAMHMDPTVGLCDLKPYFVYSPGPDRKPLVMFLDYCRYDGGSSYVTMNPLLPEKITSIAKATFGNNCNIKVLYDCKDESECSPMDEASFVTYVIEKPLA